MTEPAIKLPPPLKPESDDPFARLLAQESARRDTIEVERQFAEAERRAVYEAERREMAALVEQLGQQIDRLTGEVAKVAQAQDRMSADLGLLRVEFETLRQELAAVHGRVHTQSDHIAELRNRLDRLQTVVSGLQCQQCPARCDASAPTEPPP